MLVWAWSFFPFSPQPLREVERGAGDSEVATGMAAGQCDGDVLESLRHRAELSRLPREHRDVAREGGRDLFCREPADVIDRPEVDDAPPAKGEASPKKGRRSPEKGKLPP